MTYARGSSTCDVCGEEIGEDRAITLLADPDSVGRSFHWRCFWSVWYQFVRDPRPASDALEDIPTLGRGELRELRGRHRMPDGRRYRKAGGTGREHPGRLSA